MIEESLHVIGNSQSMSEERLAIDEGSQGDEGEVLGAGQGYQRKKMLVCLTQMETQQ